MEGERTADGHKGTVVGKWSVFEASSISCALLYMDGSKLLNGLLSMANKCEASEEWVRGGCTYVEPWWAQSSITASDHRAQGP